MLGLLCVNVFIIVNVFYRKIKICNFANDNTLYNCAQDILEIMRNLKHDMEINMKCLKSNSWKANSKQSQNHDFREEKTG